MNSSLQINIYPFTCFGPLNPSFWQSEVKVDINATIKLAFENRKKQMYSYGNM